MQREPVASFEPSSNVSETQFQLVSEQGSQQEAETSTQDTEIEKISGLQDPLADCLVYALRMQGMHLSITDLKAGLPLEQGMLPPQMAVRAVERLGVTVRFSRRRYRRIPDIVLPAVLLLKDGNVCVLLEHLDKGQAQVYWPSEADGTITVEEDELRKAYSGQVYFLRPEAPLPASAERPPSSWFWSTIRRFSPAYLQIIATAAFINVLALASPMFVMNVYDRVFPNAALSTLWVLTAGVLIAFVFDAMLKMIRSATVDVVGRRIDILLSSQIFEHFTNLRMEARPQATGEMLNHLKDFEHVREFFSSATLVAFTDLVFIGIFLLVIYMIGGPLFWAPAIAAIVVLLIGLATLWPLGRSINKTQSSASRKQIVAVETLGELEAIKLLSAEGHMQGEWERSVASTARSQQRVRFWSMLGLTSSGVVQQMASIAIIVGGVYLATEGTITMGAVIACMILTSRVVAPLGSISATLLRTQYAAATLRALNKLMSMPRNSEHGRPYLDTPIKEGTIEIEDVSFTYPGSHAPSLEQIKLRIGSGEHIGLVGRVGSGKTSLMRLISGLYEPVKGKVLVDGIDISQRHPIDLHHAIGAVMQDVVLFSGTLRENIAFGVSNVSDERILEVARITGVDEFARHHPLGYQMPIVERGRNLSGGQRQLVALARALLLNPKILVLDEPTSAMDAVTEKLFISRLTEIIEQRQMTLILASHRSSVLAIVDRLVVLEKGRIAADGPRKLVIEKLKNLAVENTSIVK